jgi:F0F1-type ATP synthase epsilon subunit
VARSLRLEILTPEDTLVDCEEVAWVQARLADGATIGIWPRHAPLIAETVDGSVRYADAEGEHAIELRGGFLHVEGGGVTILAPGRADDTPPVDPIAVDDPVAGLVSTEERLQQ